MLFSPPDIYRRRKSYQINCHMILKLLYKQLFNSHEMILKGIYMFRQLSKSSRNEIDCRLRQIAATFFHICDLDICLEIQLTKLGNIQRLRQITATDRLHQPAMSFALIILLSPEVPSPSRFRR